MRLNKFDSINVVPFIDIILVILIIVLTTSTFALKNMIPLELSSSNNKNKVKNIDILNISIYKNFDIYFNNKKINKTNILNNLKKYPTNTTINIHSDKNIKFDNFVFILNILKNNNYNNISIVTKYE